MINSNKLKGLIKENGLTQEDVAKKLGIAQVTLSLKINNKRGLSLDEANQLATILKIPACDFGTIFFA